MPEPEEPDRFELTDEQAAELAAALGINIAGGKKKKRKTKRKTRKRKQKKRKTRHSRK